MNSVTINEEDETEAANESKNGDGKNGNDAVAVGVGVGKEDKPETEAPSKEVVPDIEDTVGDVEMKNRKMEALDKIK